MTITIEKLSMPKLRVPQEVINRVSKKYPDFPRMSDEEYKNLLYLTEITINEFNVIHAMQTQIALEILENKLTDENYIEISYRHSWIEPYKKTKFEGYDQAKKHLEEVNKWHMMTHFEHYGLWWIDRENEVALLDWSSAMVDRCLAKYGETKKQKRKSVFSWEE